MWQSMLSKEEVCMYVSAKRMQPLVSWYEVSRDVCGWRIRDLLFNIFDTCLRHLKRRIIYQNIQPTEANHSLGYKILAII